MIPQSRGFVRSHDLLNTSSPLVQIKNISQLLQSLWLQDLSEWWHIARSSHPWIRMTPEWCGYLRSGDKLNTLYLHLQITHEHQTRQGADFQWEAPILKATFFNHVTTWKVNIFTVKRFMFTKHGRGGGEKLREEV